MDVSLQLDAVLVTAQKTEESLQQVPFSITAISARQVQQYRLWNSNELTVIVPNLYSSNSGDDRNVTSIRGITTTSYDPAVATYIDGVNQFGLDTYIAQLSDIERIEILRGPQGTLYGRNAMGGVINIITKQPTSIPNGFAEINVGNYGQQRYSIGLRTPMVKDKLFLRVSGLYNKRDGFYTNQFNNPFLLNQNAIAKMIDNTFHSSFTANYAGKTFNFSSQTAYQFNHRYYNKPLDADFSPIDGITVINDYGDGWNKVKTLTHEFKFTSPAATTSRLKWTAGSYLFYQDNPAKQAIHLGNPKTYGVTLMTKF